MPELLFCSSVPTVLSTVLFLAEWQHFLELAPKWNRVRSIQFGGLGCVSSNASEQINTLSWCALNHHLPPLPPLPPQNRFLHLSLPCLVPLSLSLIPRPSVAGQAATTLVA